MQVKLKSDCWTWWLSGWYRRMAKPARRYAPSVALNCEDLELRRLLTAVINVTPISELVTTESGRTAEFSVVLSEQPTNSVTIPLKSSNMAEGTIAFKRLVFTKDNWNQAQTVTVKGIDDTVTDGNKLYSIVLGPAKGDKLYRRFNPADVSLVNQDNEQIGIQVTAGTSLQTAERGATTSFTIKLLSKPTANVLIRFHSTNTQEGTVTGAVTFTSTNWSQPQKVTITGVDDSIVDGNQDYLIVIESTVSADSHYAGLSVAPVPVTNVDNDVAGLQISSTSAFSLFEGFSKDVTVRLRSQPTSTVRVNITATTGVDQGSLFVTTLTFTPANWKIPQTVTFAGRRGDGADGNQAYILSLTTMSTDHAFDALPTRTISGEIIDTDGQPLAGNYTGTYSGAVTFSGFAFFPQTGDVEFSVSNDILSVTKPDSASGRIADGSGTFAPTSGPLVGGSYTGIFIQNTDGSVFVNGTWTYSYNGSNGSGTWSAYRPAPIYS